MNFYNRETDKWYDEQIRDNFVKISEGKFVDPTKYYIESNTETSSNVDADGNIQINIGSKKVKSVSFNAEISGAEIYEV